MWIQGEILLIIVHTLWIVTRVQNNVRQLPLKTSVVDPNSLDPDLVPPFHVNPEPVQDPDPGFCWPKIKKIGRKNFSFLITNCSLLYFTLQYFTYSLWDVQATGEAFSPQKRTSSTSKNEIYKLFSIFVGHFGPTGSNQSGSGSTTLQKRVFHKWNMGFVPEVNCSWRKMAPPSSSSFICVPQFNTMCSISRF